MRIEDIALTMTPGLGLGGVIKVIESFGSAENVFRASREELMHFATLRSGAAESIVKRVGMAAAEREMKYCERHGITPIASTDEVYPRLLREANDYPHVLYIMGDPAVLSMRCVSIVGTRRCTSYGEKVCVSLVRELGEQLADVAIVSGLAYGLDAVAHNVAVGSNTPTIAVLASALPNVTPTTHSHLARQIVEGGGVLVSELSSQTKQNGRYFIARNRIIAALSSVTVVVESPSSGGSLVTANFADGYHRAVYAVPGRVTDSMSRGCNNLIHRRVASPYSSVRDLMRDMMWDSCAAADRRVESRLELDLTPDQKGLMGCFRSEESLSVDDLVELTGLSAGEIAAMMMELELLGGVRMVPGNRFEPLIVTTSR